MQIIIDDKLLEGCLKGNRLAQQQLYKNCFDLLIRICRRYVNNNEEAVDIMNQSFLKILNNLPNYRRNESFDAWIITITVHTAIDQLRKNKRYKEHVALSEDYKTGFYGYEPASTNFVISKMAADDIMKMIQQLPEFTREVFNLNIIEGYHHKEISDMLGITEEVSRWHLHKARKILKQKLTTQKKIKVA